MRRVAALVTSRGRGRIPRGIPFGPASVVCAARARMWFDAVDQADQLGRNISTIRRPTPPLRYLDTVSWTVFIA